jgi:hypothetical protein
MGSNRFGWAAAALLLATTPAHSQSQPARAPNLNGIWQAMSSAAWDLEAHAAAPGPVGSLAGAYAVAPGVGVVEGGPIPYQPAALAQRKANFDKRLELDPEVKCYLPGVPRATYMPYPFQIFQTDKLITIVHEYRAAVRTITMNSKEEPPNDTWMGWSNGRWEGNTLVVDSSGFVADTWFDRAGNFHSDALHVVERFTPIDASHLSYEATIEDPKVFTRPWKIRLTLYKNVDKNAQLLEFNCIPFAEELLYGRYRKQPASKN